MRVLSCLAVLALTTFVLAQTPPAPAAALAPAPAAPDVSVPVPADDPVENSVVKVFATVRYPDVYRPWNKQAPVEATGSGVVIEGNRILTNAHVVAYSSQVRVQANQSGEKVSATVEYIAPRMDLAVLKLEDETFFANRPALARAATLPDVRESVMVYGFPTGGASLSITKGIVSRIEFLNYGLFSSGLSIQIDAAINPGNSGGPAVVGDRMIGLAFKRLGGADNIGYIIPTEEIELFLRDVADGQYDGKPAMYDSLQTFENPALRPYLKIPKNHEGILVTEVDEPDSSYPLRQWDLITHIGEHPVDREGKVRLGRNLRVGFNYQVQNLEKDGKVPLTLVRDGEVRQVQVPVFRDRPSVIAQLNNTYPRYFICGPLVFSAATQEFVGGFNSIQAHLAFNGLRSPLTRRLFDRPAFPGEEIVVVASPFLPHELTKGYASPQARAVKAIDGVEVKNLAHLVEVLREAKGEYLVIGFQGRVVETLVFPREKLLESTEEILNDNGIRAQGSPDLMTVWNRGK